MTHHSWLVVPGFDEMQLGVAMGGGADVIVADMTCRDPMRSSHASRYFTAEWLKANRRGDQEGLIGRWVKIHPIDHSGQWREDLVAVMQGAPDGIILPCSQGPESVRQLGAELYELEQRNQLRTHNTRIIPIVGETPQAALTVTHYLEAIHQRLIGLAWGEDNLASAIGATRQADASGHRTSTFDYVRARVLLTAHALGVLALETIPTCNEGRPALEALVRNTRADGFSGMLALRADQVPVINTHFANVEPTALASKRSPDVLADAGSALASEENADGPPHGQYPATGQTSAGSAAPAAKSAPVLRPA